MRMPNPQPGVINPYTVHVHPYPTRYHGAIYTRPEFGLPYVRRPHAVFKPDDFYEYYGVSGLGSLGSGSLGLGATGQPIYYLASRTNTKVSTLQSGLNKVLTANGYKTIPVTGKLDALTCASFGLMGALYKEELLSQVPQEIIKEAARTCNLAMQNSTVKRQVEKYAKDLESQRTEPEILDPEPQPASPSGPTPQEPPSQTAPTSEEAPAIVKPVVEQPPRLVTYPEENIPEMEIPGDAPQTNYAKVGLGVAAVGALAWFFLKGR